MPRKQKTEQHTEQELLKWFFDGLKPDEDDSKALGAILHARGSADIHAWLIELAMEKINLAKQARKMERTRQPLLGKTSSRQYAERIRKVLQESEDAGHALTHVWLFIDYEVDAVSLQQDYPKSQKGRVILSAENREEWKTLSGKYTVESVAAYLMGFPRPA